MIIIMLCHRAELNSILEFDKFVFSMKSIIFEYELTDLELNTKDNNVWCKCHMILKYFVNELNFQNDDDWTENEYCRWNGKAKRNNWLINMQKLQHGELNPNYWILANRNYQFILSFEMKINFDYDLQHDKVEKWAWSWSWSWKWEWKWKIIRIESEWTKWDDRFCK
jgi:hypothetical protein